MKANCYDCKHRGNVAGSAHSSCTHPVAKEKGIEAMMIILIVGSVSLKHGDELFFIKGASHGVINGWFNWPMDFDPCWLEECTGHVEQLKKIRREQNGKI